MPLILLLLCCGPDGPTDAARHQSALSAADPAEGIALCDQIEDPRRQGDCRAALAGDVLQGTADLEAIAATCDAIRDAMWQEECWFQAADAARLVGTPAKRACDRAGRFRGFCYEHTLDRAVLVVDLPLGEERASLVELHALVRQYMLFKPDTHKRVASNRLLAERVASRWREGGRFDPALCGQLNEPLCVYAYWSSVSYDGHRVLGACETRPVTSPAAEAVGLSGWTDDGERLAQAVWIDLCQRIDRGIDPTIAGAFTPPSLNGHLLPVWSTP
ncbi:MAG: hypothetical protein AAFV53_23680 [Myxococcota bacterium]